jgi:hypothetical protein
MRRAPLAAALAACTLLLADCAGDGSASGELYYGGFWYDDAWYGGGCCVDYPGDIGPPHPEHPIAKPPDPKPTQPIATPPSSRPMPSPRPAAMPRGGGRR